MRYEVIFEDKWHKQDNFIFSSKGEAERKASGLSRDNYKNIRINELPDKKEVEAQFIADLKKL